MKHLIYMKEKSSNILNMQILAETALLVMLTNQVHIHIGAPN